DRFRGALNTFGVMTPLDPGVYLDLVRRALSEDVGYGDRTTNAIVPAEATALNFLQRLSGIATLTRRFVEAADGKITVLDTRKTTPGLRALEKYAVRCGGGTNHRFGLYDQILIKDNHVRLAGGIVAAIAAARRQAPGLTVEIEAQTVGE